MKALLRITLFGLLAACGGSDTKGETSNSQIISADKAADSSDCDNDVALVCPEGSVDGCGVVDEAGGASLTLYHICVPATETLAAAPCEQEIARQCEDGFVDACTLSPAASTVHACVAQPASLEEVPAEEQVPVTEPTESEPAESAE